MRSVLVVLALTSCYRDGAPPPSTPSNTAEPRREPASNDELAFLPIDAELVVGLDFTQMRASEVFQQLESQLLGAFDTELRKLRDCGLDPVRSIQRVTLAGKLDAQERFTGVLVVRGVDGARTLSCLAKAGASEGTVTHVDGVVTVTRADRDNVAAGLAGATTLVVRIAADASRETLGVVLASGAPLRASRVFMALYARREPGASVWGMINGQAAFMGSARQLGVDPRSVDGTLTLTDRLTAVVRLTFASDADADRLVQTLAPMLGGARAMFERFDARADGSVARFDLVATEAQVRALVGTMGGVFAP